MVLHTLSLSLLSSFHATSLFCFCSSKDKNEKMKDASLPPCFSAQYRRKKKKYAVHVSPTKIVTLFQPSFSHYHSSQTTEIPLLPPHFLPLPFLLLQITPTKQSLNGQGQILYRSWLGLLSVPLVPQKLNEFINFASTMYIINQGARHFYYVITLLGLGVYDLMWPNSPY